MENIDTLNTLPTEGQLCNTKERSCRARAYILTWNNYTENDIEYVEKYCKKNCKEFSFQEEIGKEGTKHLQIALYFKNAVSFKSLKKDFEKCHIEKAKSKNAIIKYCNKEETRNGISLKNKERIIKDPLKDKQLNQFQLKIMEIIESEPDDRTIHWFVDIEGGSGKTTLAKSICLKYPESTLYINGKAADAKYGVTSFLENKNNELKICIFDIVRSTENYVSYEAIESIKNGIFYNTKYECKMIMYNSPHIIIFANFNPDENKLSKDRWKIIKINKGSIIENEDLSED